MADVHLGASEITGLDFEPEGRTPAHDTVGGPRADGQ
jgi:hypothetical protein